MSTPKEKKKTVWFGMKLTPQEKGKIRSLASKWGVSQKQLVLELIEKELEREPIKTKPDSILELNKDLFGVGAGPGDVSTNSKYMEGFGK